MPQSRQELRPAQLGPEAFADVVVYTYAKASGEGRGLETVVENWGCDLPASRADPSTERLAAS